jgi:hypothetical protein
LLLKSGKGGTSHLVVPTPEYLNMSEIFLWYVC